jgi:hypothetical protein
MEVLGRRVYNVRSAKEIWESCMKVQDGIIIIDGYTHAQQMLSRFPC